MDNYTYFIQRVKPVAEEAGVFIGIHPDDPPVYPLGGIPRCIFGNFEGYKRALEIADSPNIGMCLCVGCWLEGGAQMGKDAVETIRYFGGIKKLFKVHFRNVTKPMPEGFVETYPRRRLYGHVERSCGRCARSISTAPSSRITCRRWRTDDTPPKVGLSAICVGCCNR